VAAFITLLVVLALCIALMMFVGNRRPVGSPLSWGEAIAAGTFVFFGLFLAYGVIPHFFLMWADNELKWRPDVQLYEYEWIGGWSLGFLQPQELGGWFPITINMQHLRDLIVVLIYVALLALFMWCTVWWQNRSTRKTTEVVPTSDYGRPLVRKA
jgi:hypothetical protein